MTLRVEMFQGAAALQTLAPAWRTLAARLLPRRHFHCVEWYLALCDTFARFSLDDILFFAVSCRDELVAVLPFRRIAIDLAGVEVRALQLLSNVLEAATVRDIVLPAPSAHPELLDVLVRHFDRTEGSWDLLSFPGLLQESGAVGAIGLSPKLPLTCTPAGLGSRIELVSCGDSDQPFARLSKGFRQNLRTAHNNLRGQDVRFITATTPSELAECYPAFLSVESSGWKGEEGTSVARQPIVDKFLQNVMAHFGPRGECEIHLMSVDDRTVAAMFCVVIDDVCFIARTGYDETFSKVSPGHLILEYVIRRRGAAGHLKAVTPYNSPRWFEAWKPDVVLPILNAYVFRPSLEGLQLRNRVETSLRRRAADVRAYLEQGGDAAS